MADPARRSRALLRGLTMAAFAAALVYLFFGEHRVHLLGWSPLLLFFLCPLLHLTHHQHGGEGRSPPAPPARAEHQPPSPGA